MWVAPKMGRTDWTMIVRIYSRWIPETAPDAGNRAVALFSAPSGAKKAG